MLLTDANIAHAQYQELSGAVKLRTMFNLVLN